MERNMLLLIGACLLCISLTIIVSRCERGKEKQAPKEDPKVTVTCHAREEVQRIERLKCALLIQQATIMQEPEECVCDCESTLVSCLSLIQWYEDFCFPYLEDTFSQ